MTLVDTHPSDEAETQVTSSEETSPSDGYATGADSWVMPKKAPSAESEAEGSPEPESKSSESTGSEETTSPSSVSTPKSDVTELQRASPV